MNTEQTQSQNGRDALRAELRPEWLKVVYAQVESLKFGTVQITVHDSKVVQIERVEKTRLDRPQPSS
jgi:hypothetical protein